MHAPLAALPFSYTRSSHAHYGTEHTTTTETAHGLLRLEPDRLVIQWRVRRTTQRMGSVYETSGETDPVEEASVPVLQLASAEVRRARLPFGWGGATLVLTANDLRAFERVAGPAGLSMEHPSQLEFEIARRDRDAAEAFAGELELAISEQQLLRLDRREVTSAEDVAPRRDLPPRV